MGPRRHRCDLIVFNIPQVRRFLQEKREVFTWRQSNRPTGRQLAIGMRVGRLGIVIVHRLPKHKPEQYAHYFNRSGFDSWPDWRREAERVHKDSIETLRLYYVHFEGEANCTMDNCRQIVSG